MREDTFLQHLRAALQGLSQKEIDDILADYRAHFAQSRAHGRSDPDTAAALGQPQWLAREHIADLRPPPCGIRARVRRCWQRLKAHRRNRQMVERELDWKPGEDMAITLPAEVSWKPAAEPRAILSGPAWLVEHVRLDSQRLHGRFKWRFFQHQPLRVELQGPAITSWSLSGSGVLALEDVSQAALRLALDGSGDIRVQGRAAELQVLLKGSGDIDLGELSAERASATVAGYGDLRLAARQAADLAVEGSGDIELIERPPQLKTRVSGSGDIRLPD